MATPVFLLITKADIKPYAQIALQSRDEEMLLPHILAAQNIDVAQVLGNSFFTDLIQNRNELKYRTLLEGGTYDYEGETKTFQGLSAAIACYTYSRYILAKNAIDTPFSVVAKTNEFSEQADAKLIMKVSSDKRSEGTMYLNQVMEFLEDNYQDYPLFKSSCKDTIKKQSISRLTPASRI